MYLGDGPAQRGVRLCWAASVVGTTLYDSYTGAVPFPEDTLSYRELSLLRLRARDGDGRRVSQAMFAGWLGITSNSYARLERGELRLRVPMARLAVYTLAEHTGQSVGTVRDSLSAQREALKKAGSGREQKRSLAAYGRRDEP